MKKQILKFERVIMSLFESIKSFEKKKKMECPHCFVLCLFSFCDAKEIEIRREGEDINDRKIKEQRYATCINCNRAIIEIRDCISKYQKNFNGRLEEIRNGGNWEIIYPKIICICSNESIPEEIRKNLNEANSIKNISGNAAAGLVRKTLEIILVKYLSLKGDYLCELVKKSKDKIPKEIYENLDNVRLLGILGIHMKEDYTTKELIDVDSNEVELVIEKVIELVNYLFLKKDDSRYEKIQNKYNKTKKIQKNKSF